MRNRIIRPRWLLFVSSVISGAALLAVQVGQDGAHAQGPPAVQVEVINPELQVIVIEEPAGPVPFQARLSGNAVTEAESIDLETFVDAVDRLDGQLRISPPLREVTPGFEENVVNSRRDSIHFIFGDLTGLVEHLAGGLT